MTKSRMWKLVYDLRDFAYDSGYISGSSHDGTELHKETISKRDAVYDQLQNVLSQLETRNSELYAACTEAVGRLNLYYQQESFDEEPHLLAASEILTKQIAKLRVQ